MEVFAFQRWQGINKASLGHERGKNNIRCSLFKFFEPAKKISQQYNRSMVQSLMA